MDNFTGLLVSIYYLFTILNISFKQNFIQATELIRPQYISGRKLDTPTCNMILFQSTSNTSGRLQKLNHGTDMGLDDSIDLLYPILISTIYCSNIHYKIFKMFIVKPMELIREQFISEWKPGTPVYYLMLVKSTPNPSGRVHRSLYTKFLFTGNFTSLAASP